MPESGSNGERERLAKYYASLTEGELEKLAADAWSLTDVARETLKAEIARRGSRLEVRDSRPDEDRAHKIVVLEQFRDLPVALLAKSILDSAGITCFLQDENIIRLNWLWSDALGGIRLLVREEDAADAAKLLQQKPVESFEISSGEYKQPRCPVCGSVDVSFGVKGRHLSYLTIAAGVPLPVNRSGWRCESCSHKWG